MPSATSEKAVLSTSGASAADYRNYQYYGGYHSAEQTITLNAAQGGWCEGPIQGKSNTGQEVTLMTQGVSNAKSGGVWAVMDPLCINSSGKFVKALNSSDYIVGRALEVSANNEIHSMFITHEGFGSAHAHLLANGRGLRHTLRFSFDPENDATKRPIAAYTMDETLPINAVVLRTYYFVTDIFTSDSTDAGTISIGHADDAAGLLAATAISAGGNIWDPGWFEGIQDAATIGDASVVTAAERAIVVTVAVEALLTGKFIAFLDYVIID